jgi:hypothetical protein
MIDYDTKMLVYHERFLVNKAVHIFQHPVNEDPELFIEAQAAITATVSTMLEESIEFDILPGSILYFTSGQGKGRQTWMVGR